MSNCETLSNKHFVDKGIPTVKNIIDESGQPLSWVEERQKYNLTLNRPGGAESAHRLVLPSAVLKR